MLKLAGEFTEEQLAEHTALLGAHHKSIFEELRTGAYYTGRPWRVSGNTALAANTLYGSPFLAARDITVDRILLNVTTAAAGKSIRMGIYKADGTNLYPGSLLLDAGTVATDTTGVKLITINQALTKGLYFLAHVSDGTPSIKGVEPALSPLGDMRSLVDGYSDNGWSVAFTYAALPDPFTAGGTVQAYPGGSVFLRLASLD